VYCPKLSNRSFLRFS